MNIFIFSFNSNDDMQWVMSRRPWLFEASQISLKEFDGYTPIFEMDFSTEAFWYNTHDLPIGCINVKIGNHVGSLIWVVQECNVNEDGTGWGITLRMHIELKLEKPISRGQFINVEGNRYWIPLTYEMLPKDCSQR